ncbi:MAG: winged helix DNA-binding protein [Candidatus Gracilibacteria bacterium]|jgi:DNA-binding MarR family transcriptional regulator|nr:winged helix DNA-binding protein [Candidatus Gracilibacteria bacterium]
MKELKDFPKFVKKLFYEHNISHLNLNINKTQAKILMIMDSLDNKTMSEISKEVALEKSSFTRSIRHLIEIKYIIKKPSETDQRVLHLLITEKGNKAIKAIKEDWDKYFASIMSSFSPEEKEEFTKAVKIISKYINKITI